MKQGEMMTLVESSLPCGMRLALDKRYLVLPLFTWLLRVNLKHQPPFWRVTVRMQGI